MPTKAHYPFSCATSAQYSTHDKTLPPPPPLQNSPHGSRHEKSSSPEERKKYCESPKIPMVPGPAMSARTFTMEKAPLRMPKPRPDTATWQTNTCHQRQCHMANKHMQSMSHGKQTPVVNITATWQTPASNNTTAWQTKICHQHHYHTAKRTPCCQHQNTP